MGRFRRRAPGPHDHAGGEGRPLQAGDLQFAAIAVADNFAQHDQAASRVWTLPGKPSNSEPAGLCSRTWTASGTPPPKSKGLSPTDLSEYNAVSGVRDLLTNLCNQADLAAHNDAQE
jgi:hypothetical protein